jgi:hypothetical protein
VDREIQIPSPPASQVGDALAPKSDHRARLRPRTKPHMLKAVEGLDLELGPKCGLHHRHLHHREQVLASTLEHRALPYTYRKKQVPGRATRPTGVSMARDPKLHAVRHTGWNVDGDGAFGWHPSLAPASLALRLDLLPRPLTRGAPAGRHHRAEDAAPNLLDLSGTAAGSAAGRRGPGLRTRALAAVAGLEGVHRDVPADPERRFFE